MIRDGTEKMKQGMWRRQYTGLLHSFKRYHLDQCTFPLCHKVDCDSISFLERRRNPTKMWAIPQLLLSYNVYHQKWAYKTSEAVKRVNVEMAFQILTDSICMSSHKEWLHPGLMKNAFWEHGQSEGVHKSFLSTFRAWMIVSLDFKAERWEIQLEQ